MATPMKSAETVYETNLPLPVVGKGKVRDVYAVGEDKLLVVTSDRLSAFDVVLPDPIPFKGKVLNQISKFWFDHFASEIKHHLISTDINEMGLSDDLLREYGDQLEGRTMLVKRAKPLTVECVVRGYVTGSGWKDYLKTGAVCGHSLPEGLKQCQQFPQPLYTPATKAEQGEHDENIDFEQAAKRDGEELANRARELSLMIYRKGAEFAATKGIIIADTKFEFGVFDGELILIDEVLTPDSSRFWPKDTYEPGHDQPSYDKQIVRNYLEEIKFNKQPPGPKLPAEVIEKTGQAYRDVYKRLTGQDLK